MTIQDSHMQGCGNVGVKLADFQAVLPALGIRQIQWLLKEMERNGIVHSEGHGRGARWYLGEKERRFDN